MQRLLLCWTAAAAVAALAACGESTPRSSRGASDDAQRAPAATGEQADAARETRRLAALWNYHDIPAGKDRQLTASIYSANDVDTDGLTAKRVQLVFRDHPSWGRSSYLVLQAGDFACDPGCPVAVAVDNRPARRMKGRRPRTDEAVAMFIDDARGLWRLIDGAARLEIEFPVAAGGTRTAVFEVAGLDRSRLPGWD